MVGLVVVRLYEIIHNGTTDPPFPSDFYSRQDFIAYHLAYLLLAGL